MSLIIWMLSSIPRIVFSFDGVVCSTKVLNFAVVQCICFYSILTELIWFNFCSDPVRSNSQTENRKVFCICVYVSSSLVDVLGCAYVYLARVSTLRLLSYKQDVLKFLWGKYLWENISLLLHCLNQWLLTEMILSPRVFDNVCRHFDCQIGQEVLVASGG